MSQPSLFPAPHVQIGASSTVPYEHVSMATVHWPVCFQSRMVNLLGLCTCRASCAEVCSSQRRWSCVGDTGLGPRQPCSPRRWITQTSAVLMSGLRAFIVCQNWPSTNTPPEANVMKTHLDIYQLFFFFCSFQLRLPLEVIFVVN